MITAPTSIRYRIIAVSMMMAFILYLDRICLGEIVKSASFKNDLHLDKEQIGRILGAFFFTYALFQIPAGWASDRFGGRAMLTAYIILWSLFTGLTGLMTGFVGLLVMRLLCGAAEAGAYPTSGALIRRWIPLEARARASSLVTFGGRLGGTLAPFLTAWMIVILGSWRASLWVDALVGLVIAWIYWTVVRDRPTEHPGCNDAERHLIGSPPGEAPLSGGELRTALGSFCRSRSLWLNAASQWLINIGWVYLVTWLPTYLAEEKHVEAIDGGRMVTLVLATGMIGQLAGGWLSDQCVKRIGLRWGRVLPMTVSGLLAASAYVSCLFVDSAWGIVACCAVVSFATDLGNPSIWAFMQDVGGRATAVAAGWGNMWGNFGASLSSMLVPWLLLHFGTSGGGQTAVFLTLAGAFLLSGIVALGIDATRPLLTNESARTAKPG